MTTIVIVVAVASVIVGVLIGVRFARNHGKDDIMEATSELTWDEDVEF